MSRLRMSDLADLIRARNEPSDVDERNPRQNRSAVGAIDAFRSQAADEERSMRGGGFGRSQAAQDFVNRDTADLDAAIAEQARRAEAQQKELDRLSWWERFKNIGARLGAGMNPDAQVSPAEMPLPDPQAEAARIMEEQRKEQVRKSSPYYQQALIELQAEDRLKRLDAQYQREADERLKGVGLPRIGLRPGQQPPTMGQAMAEEIAQRTREDRARESGYQYETEVLAEDPFGRTQMRSGTPGESPQYPLLRDIGMGLRGAGGALGSVALRMLGQDDLANQAQAYIEGQRMRQEQERTGDRFPSMTRAAAGATESAATLLGASAVGGMPAVIATYGAEAFDQGLYDAKQAGLTGNDQLRYAAGEAAIASLVSPIMDRLGMSGVEKAAMAQRVANRTMRNAFGNLAKTQAGELGQELLELSLSSALQAETGVDPQALELSTFMPRVADTALTTMLTVGAVESPNIAAAVDRFIREPSRKNYAGLPEEIRAPLGDTVKSAADRQRLAEQLIANQVQNERWQVPPQTDPLETARNRRKPEETLQPGVTSPPGPSAGSPQLPMGTPGVQPEDQGVPSQVPVLSPGEEVIVDEERMQRGPEGRQREVVAPPVPDPTERAGGIPVAAEPAAPASMSETEWREMLQTPEFQNWLRQTARNNVAKGSPNPQEDADDLFQTMYYELLRNEKARQAFDPAKGNLKQWLGGILGNTAADVKREAARGPRPTEKTGDVRSRYGDPAIEAQIRERAAAEGIDINVPEVPDVPQVGNAPPQPDPGQPATDMPKIRANNVWVGPSGPVRINSTKGGLVTFKPVGAAGEPQTLPENEFRQQYTPRGATPPAQQAVAPPAQPSVPPAEQPQPVDTIAGRMELNPANPPGAKPASAKEPWQMTRDEAIASGIPFSDWQNAVSDAYRNERLPEDSPAWNSLNESSPDDFSGVGWIGSKVAVLAPHRRLYGTVESAIPGGVILRHADGRTSKQSASNLVPIEAWIADQQSKGRDIPDEALLISSTPEKTIGQQAEPESQPAPAMSFEQFAEVMDIVSNAGAPNGATVTFGEMRKATGLSKSDFDATVLRFKEEGKLKLELHDFKSSLTDQDRETYVVDGRGNYYTAASFTPSAREEIARKLRQPTSQSNTVDPVYSTAEEAPDLGVYLTKGSGPINLKSVRADNSKLPIRYAVRDAVNNKSPKGWGDRLFNTEQEARDESARIRLERQKPATTPSQPEATPAPPAESPQKPVKPRTPGKPLNRTQKEAALRHHFTPGRIVPSYSGQDLVIAFNPGGPESTWSVDVQAVDERGNPIEGERVRRHGTEPDAKTLLKAYDDLVASQQAASDAAPELSDVDQAIRDALMAELAPSPDPQSAPQAGKRKRTEAKGTPPARPRKPRSGIGQKTEAAAEKSKQELKDAVKELGDIAKDLGILSGVPLEPKAVAATVKVVKAAVKAGITSFADYAVFIAENLNEQAARKLAPYLERGWAMLKTIPGYEQIDEAGSVTEVLDARTRPQAEPTADATTVKPGDAVRSRMRELSDAFAEHFDAGNGFDTIIDARKFASDLLGIPVPTGTIQAKLVEEAIETGVVLAARKIIENGRGNPPGDTYQALTDLYSRQPNLKTRVSESMIGQQYSTPVPLAYLASRLAGVTTGRESIYEPTAGNGMLLIASDPDVAIANELDSQRAAALKSQGFQVTERDATEYRPSGTVSAVIANPPFGAVRNEAGESQKWTVAGVTTREADHAIALRALGTLAKDGKAVLILGAKGHNTSSDLDRRKAYLGKKAFYETLYREYPVTDHFTVSGSLYSRQGASFPVDVIVIDKSATGSISLPWASAPPVYSSWESLGNEKLEVHRGRTGNSANGGQGSGNAQGSNMGSLSGSSGDATGGTGERGEGVRGGGRSLETVPAGVVGPGGDGRRSEELSGTRLPTGVSPDTGEREPGGPRPVPDRRDGDSGGGDRSEQAGLSRITEWMADGLPAVEEPGLDEALQTAYQPGSSLKSADTLVPVNQASALRAAIEDLQARHGDLTEFVATQLDFTPAQMKKAFLAEQVDALAMAIDNHQRGFGFIIGDQTGVGKGRVNAGMIWYAMRQGLVPVFVTEKLDLFASMVGDLADIGVSLPEAPFTPLILNDTTGTDVITFPDGRVVKASAKQSQDELRKALSNLEENGEFASPTQKYDALFMTYSQMRPAQGASPRRRDDVRRLAGRSYLILDESHIAGGSEQGKQSYKKKNDVPNQAEFFREIVGSAANVFYSSATFAKRSSVMDLYSRTGMIQAVDGDASKLAQAIETGGVPLQQIVSRMLSESGQYVRREKSFDGIDIETKVVSTDLKQADDIASVFAAIREFDAALQPVIAEIESELVSSGKIRASDSGVGEGSVIATGFTSLMHNSVDQMLFSLKADQAANEAIEAVRRNEKPVIAVDLTLESLLDEYVKENNLTTGSTVSLSMKDVLRRYLERQRRIGVKPDKESDTYYIVITEEQMGPEVASVYSAAKQLIDDMDLDIPASPIDWIRYRLEKEGIRVREITGRKAMLKYSGANTSVLQQKSKDEAGTAGKQRTISEFNSGDVDVVILNRSGSTGLSIHASEKFQDQRRRHMIVAQAAKNIDEFMQTLGRINRTGQVRVDKQGQTVLPRYTILMTDAPAEKRPAAVLAKKLSSLNASVTAKGKGAVGIDAADLMNQVGGYVIAEYLLQEPQLAEALDVRIPDDLEKALADDLERLAKAATGRLASMPVRVQQDFYDAVESAYNDRIDTLTAMNANPLIAQTLDLRAKTLDRIEVFHGEADAGPFGQPAYMERVKVRVLTKPYSRKDIATALSKSIQAEDLADIRDAQRTWMQQTLSDLDARHESAVAAADERYISEESRTVARHRLAVSRDTLRENIERYPVGSVVDVVLEEGQLVRGVVLSVSVPPEGSGNAAASGRWKWKIAVNNEVRVVSVSGYSLQNTVMPAREATLRDTIKDFEDAQNVTTAERWIATGNILAAYAKLGLRSGSVTFYTDDSGDTRSGVLMPRSFSATQWMESQPVTFTASDDVRRYFEAGGDVLSTPDAVLHVRIAGRSFVFRAPVATSKGGKYTKNKAILRAAAGEQFVSRGRFMEMTVSGPTAKAVLDAVLESTSLQAVSPADREVARTVLGITKTGASISSADDRDSGTQRAGLPAKAGTTGSTYQPPAGTPTREGKRLLRKIQRDIGRKNPKVGLRSIVEFVNNLGHTLMLVGNTQLGKTPAHFEGDTRRSIFGPAITRTRTGTSQINFHEAGHGLSNFLRDSEARFFYGLGEQLKALANEPGFASAITIEEGIAEWVRRYIVGESIPDSLMREMEKRLAKRPEVLQGLRDAREAYRLHITRDPVELARANQADGPKDRNEPGGFKELLWVMARNTFGNNWVMMRLNHMLMRGLTGGSLTAYDPTGFSGQVKSLVNRKYRAALKTYRALRAKIKDSGADVENAYTARLLLSDEVARIMGGVTHDREGVRIPIITNLPAQMLDDAAVQALKDSGFDISDELLNAKTGQYVYLSDKSFATIEDEVGRDNYPAFEIYAQYKAALDRHTKKGLLYPGQYDHLPPSRLKSLVEDMEQQHPEWIGHFKDIQKLMDQMLLVSVLTGEHSVDEAIRIKQAWDDYVPLQKQVEDRLSYLSSGDDGMPMSAGIQKTKTGSLLEFRPLKESVEYRVRRALGSHVENNLRQSIINQSRVIGGDKSLPYDMRKAFLRLAMPMHKEPVAVAKLSVGEVQDMAVAFMNRQLYEDNIGPTESGGKPLSDTEIQKGLKDAGLDAWTVEDISVSLPSKTIYRSKSPRAVRVFATMVPGGFKFYQMSDPFIYSLFQNSSGVHKYVRWIATFLGKPLAPLRRVVTQNFMFPIASLFRDASFAAEVGSGVKTMIPGYITAVGVVNRLLGDPEGIAAKSRTETLSRSMDHTTSDLHKSLVEKFKDVLAEGIVIPGWSNLSGYEKLAEAPGIAMSTVLKPGDIFNFLFFGKWLSATQESMAREGAQILSKRRGESELRQNLEYARASGFFIQRQPNALASDLVRMALFLNPALQVTGQRLAKVTDADPAVRAQYWAMRIPTIAAFSALAAAGNYLMMRAMIDDDDEWEEIRKRYQERTEDAKLGKMLIGGSIELPFDYGIGGSAASFAWNTVEDELWNVSPQEGEQRAWALIKRAGDVPMPTELIHPFYKTAKELWENHSEFMDREIVPHWLIRQFPNNPELQTTDDVGRAYNSIGSMIGASPLKVRYAVRNMLGSDVAALVDVIGNDDPGIKDIPILGRLFLRDPQGWRSRSVRSVIDLDDQYRAAEAVAEQQLDRADVPDSKKQQIRDTLKRTRAAHQMMLEIERQWGKAKTQDEKKAVSRQITDMAREYIGEHALPPERIAILVENAISEGKSEKAQQESREALLILKQSGLSAQEIAQAYTKKKRADKERVLPSNLNRLRLRLSRTKAEE